MDFQHVRSFIKQRLFLSISLGLIRGETQVLNRRSRLTAGRGVRQVASRVLGLRLRCRQSYVHGFRPRRQRHLSYFRAEPIRRDGNLVVS